MTELRVGERLAERYEVERLLGEGGLARVYQVRHLRLGTRYALKHLSVSRRGLQARLLREGRIQAQLQHPHVVRVLDVLDIYGQPSLIMEYVEGSSLEELIRSEGAMSTETALPLFAQILSGVAAAHNAGVLHRDLKPANILLSRTSQGWLAKVADFGIAKMAVDDGQGNTRTGIQMGTPGYMAPEQVLDAAGIDSRADIFALGVVLYEMLVGSRPFGGASEFETLDTTVRGRYRPVSEALEHCPESLRNAVAGALARHPDDRFDTCRDFAEVAFADHPELLMLVDAARGSVLIEEDLETVREAPREAPQNRTSASTLTDLDSLGSVFAQPEGVPSATLAPVSTSAPSDSCPEEVETFASSDAAPEEKEAAAGGVWLFGGVLGVGAAAVGALAVLVVGVIMVLKLGPGLAPEEVADAAGVSVPPPTEAAVPVDAEGQSEENVVVETASPDDRGDEGTAESDAVVASTQPSPAAQNEEPQAAAAAGSAASSAVGPTGRNEASQPGEDALGEADVPVPEEGGPVAVVDEPAVDEPEPEPEPEAEPPPAVPEVLGRWKGRANGRPLTLHITAQDGTALRAEVSFYLGSTERRVAVTGRIDPDGALMLGEAGGSELRLTGGLSGATLSGTYSQKGQKKPLEWAVSR